MPFEVHINPEIQTSKEMPTSSDSPLHQELGESLGAKCGQDDITRSDTSVEHESKTNQDGSQPLLPRFELYDSDPKTGQKTEMKNPVTEKEAQDRNLKSNKTGRHLK